MTLRARLAAHRLLEQAEAIAARVGAELEAPAVLRELAAAMRDDGWSQRNVERVLELPAAGGEVIPLRRRPGRPRKQPPPPPPSATLLRLRPRLVQGDGERHLDCAEYGACLDRLLQATPDARDAHCPPRCDHYEPTPRHVAIGLASPRCSPLAAAQEQAPGTIGVHIDAIRRREASS